MSGIFRGDGVSGTGQTAEEAIAGKVNRTGDTMTGALLVPAGAAGQQVPQKQEVDAAITAAIAVKANIASPTFTGTVGGITGAMITNTPAGGISSVTAQAAINELDTEKEAAANKSTTLVADLASDTKFPSVKSVYDWVVGVFATIAQVHYVGTTSIAANRASAAQTLTGVNIDGNAGGSSASCTGNAATATTIAGTSSPKLPAITATQATGAITVSASSMYLDFRSTTLTSGTISTVLAAPASLVIPDGATLGSVTTVAAEIVVIEMNNAGTAELAVVNLSGGNDLSERGLISTTAIGTGSDSANVFYSTTARTNLTYRVVGSFTAVNTAGTWDSPTLVQGAGGQVGVEIAMHSEGNAPMYACRAWCSFVGATTGTNAPTAGGNVTSVTRNGTGNYTINFANALPHAFYVPQIICTNSGTTPTIAQPGLTGPSLNSNNFSAANITTTSFQFQCGVPATSVAADPINIYVAIFA